VIKTNEGKGDWRCPDFVVLDFEDRKVIVVEVTTAWSIRPFIAKAIELHDEGMPRLRQQLMTSVGSVFPKIESWETKIQLFVREDRAADLRKALENRGNQFDVVTLEEAFRRWKW
jgi:hypothetical protein